MGMSVGKAGQTSVKSEPNVVPMIDIMLVLLIIFMIVTPLIAAGFKATMPRGANPDKDPEGEEEIVLGIDVAGHYFLDTRAVPEGTLLDQLRARYSGREKDKILYLKADQQLPYAKVQEAVETAREAGVRVVHAITEQESNVFKSLAGEKKKGAN